MTNKGAHGSIEDDLIGQMKKTAFVVMIIAIVLCGCKKQPSKVYNNWNKGRVDLPGKYIDEKENITLDVYGENGLLRYRLISGKDTVLKSNENASIYQKWFLFFDDNNNLWVDSSDIGMWVWLKGNDNKYLKNDINTRPKHVAVPRQFIASLSDAERKHITTLAKARSQVL